MKNGEPLAVIEVKCMNGRYYTFLTLAEATTGARGGDLNFFIADLANCHSGYL